MSSANARRQLMRAEQAVRAIVPPEPDPEQVRRENERFLNDWAGDIVKAAHAARDRRARGEQRYSPIEGAPGLEIMAEAVSYGGHAPPESVRAALRESLDADVWPEISDPETLERLNAAPREALRRAFVLYGEETQGPAAGQ